MGEVAGADHADAFAARPGGEMLEIEIPARRPRVFRVDVQVRVEAHVSHARAAWMLQPSIWEKRRGYKGVIRPRAKSTPVDERRELGPASLLGAAAQDFTRGARHELRAAVGLALNKLIEFENLGSRRLGTGLENYRLRPCSLRSRSSSSTRIRSARRSWRTGCARPATFTWCASPRPRTCSLASTPS